MPRSLIIGLTELIYLALVETAKHFFQSIFTYLHSYQKSMNIPLDLYLHQHMVTSVFLNLSILMSF